MTPEEIAYAANLACRRLIALDYENAASSLAQAITGIQKLTCNKSLGMPRGIDMDGEHYYALVSGAVWEFDQDGWYALMERREEGRGYYLGDYGRCLTMEVCRLNG